MKDAFQLLPRTELIRQRRQLLARIQRRYEIVEDPYSIGPLRFTFTRVKDANRVLDEVCAEEDAREKNKGDRRHGNDLHLPYWAELWDSSLGVGHWLVVNRNLPLTPSPPRPLTTLDLGCGMGLTGTVAAAMGHEVTLVDLETPALLFARLNTLPYSRRVKVRKLNWQADRLPARFDLILGADVLYERIQWDYLEPFWRAHLADNGAVLLGEPGRMTGDRFGEWITARGWTLTLLSQPIPGRSLPIRLFLLHRGSPEPD